MRHNAPFSKIEPAGRRGQWRRGLLLAAVAVLALAASLVMTPAPAEAQSNVTMVSNLATSLGSTTNVLAGGSHPRYASTFTTGPAGGGYGLALVRVYMGIGSSGSRTPDVAIHSDSNGVPGQRLFALDPPDAVTGIPDFTPFGAPPGTRLTANTTYWVVVGTSSGDVRLLLTDADGELSGKQPGWSIGNNLVSMSGPDASWVSDPRSVRMAVEGVVFDSFVSNLGLTGDSGAAVGRFGTFTATQAFSFTTGTNRGGYRLTSVTLRLRRGDDTLVGDAIPDIRIYRDSDGVPGSEFIDLFHVGIIGNMPQSYTNRTFFPATNADTRLPPNRTYWVVATGTWPNGQVFWSTTRSSASAEQAGWSIPNGRLQGGTPWQSGTNTLMASVQGEVLRTSDLPTRTEWADYDLPLSDDTWGYVDTSGPSSGTLNDPLDDLRSNGDRWRLHVDSGRRYRVEVNFGSATPQDGYDEGGGIDVWDFRPRSDLWDHRSDDGRAFVEFYTSPRTPYYLLVRARSFGEHQTWEYFGDYTITLTDISHIWQMVSNGGDAIPILGEDSTFPISGATSRIGELPEFEGSVNTYERATSFTTGPLSAGYRLEYITVGLWRGSGVPSVKVALYTESDFKPGTKLFDFERISGITNAYSALIGDRFWVPANAAHLTAGTTYWVVFENETPGTYYRVRRTSTAKNNAGAASGWSIGGKISQRDTNLDAPHWGTIAGAFVMDIHASHASTGSATETVDQAAPQLQSASVDGSTLTLAYDEELDLTSSPPSSAFTVNVNGEERPLVSVGVGQSSVLLSLSTPVEAGDTVSVDYTVPTGESEGKVKDPAGNAASSFTGQQVTNDTASSGGSSGGGESGEADPPAAVPLTATAHGVPADHDGSTTFSFELRFSETPEDDFSYKTLRDHAFSVTGGEVVKANRLVNGENVRWQVHVAPDGSGAATIVLPPTTDCEAEGAVCTEDGRMLSHRLEVSVPKENTAATGAPTIRGIARVGQTLMADTSAISDADGLDDDTFDYQWIANDGAADADINGATGRTYTLVDADEGKAIMVRVSFTDDGGNAESLTSAATAVVTERPNTAATGSPTITGTAHVGETLTAGTTAISDADGLDDDTFDYQWIANDGAADAEISGATGRTYTLVDADEGKAIMVRVSFTDEAGNDESLTSAATALVTAAPSSIPEDEEEEETTPLTAGAHDVPGSHDGSTTFSFELRFSEQIPLSYVTLRDHAFTVTGGEVTKARRLEPGNSAGKNVRWEISVTPDGNGAVTVVLPPTTDCEAEGAICTGDGGMLSNRLEITVPGPGG